MNQFLLISLFMSASLFAEIKQVSNFQTLLENIEFQETLVVCDIDNTLFKASEYLGSIEWADEIKSKLQAQGMTEKEAGKLENLIWRNVQPHIRVELVDPETPNTIKALQAQKIHIMALTSRSPEEVEYSLSQLHSLAIELTILAENSQTFFLEEAALYKSGVLFASPFNKKSEVLLAFLEKNKLSPKRVVFIDDKLHHVQDVVEALKIRGIPCLGLWFFK